jgi:hypothetical protein
MRSFIPPRPLWAGRDEERHCRFKQSSPSLEVLQLFLNLSSVDFGGRKRVRAVSHKAFNGPAAKSKKQHRGKDCVEQS